MSNFNIGQFAADLISRNPQVANNPQAANLLDVIRSGDRERGEQIAQNLCDTYGVSREEAISRAKQFFNIG